MKTEPIAPLNQFTKENTLLKTVNYAAASILSINDENQFEESLTKIMELISGCVDAERVHIWKDGIIDGKQVLIHKYKWYNESAEQKINLPVNANIPYDALPDLDRIKIYGQILYYSLSAMPSEIRIFFDQFKVKSIVIIPMFLQNKFWGVFTLDNFKNERTLSEDEINILQLLGLMMINAVQRNESLIKLNEEHEKLEKLAHWYHSILDAIPLPISVTDSQMNWKFVNMAVENFLGIKRADMLGKPCSNWNADICNTDNCGIECIKRGNKLTYFNQNNSSFKVDVEILKDLNGETAGYIEIVQDVTQIETMAKRQAAAESASSAKSTFLANMSHEMRTPMNAMLGIAEIQLQNDNLSEDAANAFSQIYESGDLLLNIINDILDLSKIEAGKFEIIPVNYDIPSLINDTAQLNRLRFESSPIEFILNIDENTPHDLSGDEIRIKQILNNILSNAFKYTSKGTVELSVSSELLQDNDVIMIFRISDTGQGMNKAEVEKLFDEYTRFNATANRDKVGTGLGMSISKHLVDLMNGTINVESEPNVGSVFTVRIPQKRNGNSICGAELAKRLHDFRFQGTTLNKKTRFIREYMPYGSVLVVDDVESNIYVAKGMLSPYGLNIDTASSGFEAIEKVKNGSVYDIIFMDHMMPKMDGIEAVKIIRQSGYNHYIIALTANVLIGQEKKFLENGFNGFVSKPIDSRELNHYLNDFIRNKKTPEVVQAARQMQQEKEQAHIKNNSKITENLSKLKIIFSEDAKRAVDTLEELSLKFDNITEDDLKLYIITVHGMKSALANIGEKELSDAALKLERAGYNNDINTIKNNTADLINRLKAMIENTEALNNNSDDMSYLNEKLYDIKIACAKFNKTQASEALNALKQKKWPDHISKIIDEISTHISHSAFKKAIAAAESI